MALLALSAPVTNLTDPQFVAGAAVPVIGSATALTGTTGFTVPWVPGLVLVIFSGATAAGNTTLVAPQGPVVSQTVNVAASAGLLFGPIGSAYAAPATGLVQVNVTTVTTAAVYALLLPAATGLAKHNPFEVNIAAADY